MQKHADRTDKRPPIIAGPSMGQDLWPKMDPSLYQGYADRLDPYGQGLMDHRWVETRAVTYLREVSQSLLTNYIYI